MPQDGSTEAGKDVTKGLTLKKCYLPVEALLEEIDFR